MKMQTLGEAIVEAAKTGNYRIESREEAEVRAYQDFREVMEAAFKADGFRGVVQTAESLVEISKDKVSEYEAAGEDEETRRSSLACYIDQLWAPVQLHNFSEIEEAGGVNAILAGQKAPAKKK